MLAAPCSGDRGALLPPMSDRHHPGLIALTKIPVPARSSASARVMSFIATLVVR